MTPDRRVVPFKHWHYEWLIGHESLEYGPWKPPVNAMSALERENSWTGVVDGEVVVCAGTIQQWPTRHVAWAYIAQRTGVRRHMPWITEETINALNRVKGRVELTVRVDFPAGQRWAQRLGFHIETPCLKMFGPEGEDHIGFLRIN